ncbi:uncharacterized protein DS421_6g193820 [Arachis hypogaea]|nr:uncharacterized protein DS421_6g193820 [Arachis hypogaea]
MVLLRRRNVVDGRQNGDWAGTNGVASTATLLAAPQTATRMTASPSSLNLSSLRSPSLLPFPDSAFPFPFFLCFLFHCYCVCCCWCACV